MTTIAGMESRAMGKNRNSSDEAFALYASSVT
jgi:hypothetical protein